MVTRKALPWLVLLLALPAARGQDEPKKDDKPPPTAKEQFTALVKDHAAERQKMVTEIGKLKGDERSELLQKYFGLGKEYAVKVYQLAEDHPTDPVAADAVFWVLANGAGSTVSQKAEAKVAALVAEQDLPPPRAFALKWEDDPYSSDLTEEFKKVLVGANPPRHDSHFPWECDQLDVTGVPFSVGGFYRANSYEHRAAEQLLKQLPTELGQRSLLIVSANTSPARRVLRSLCGAAPLIGQHLVAVTGDSIGFSTLYRDAGFAWNIRALPVPLVAFTHANPIAWDAEDTKEPFPLLPPNGTDDAYRNSELITQFIRTTFTTGPLPDADELATRLHQLDPPFFDEHGDRLAASGEYILWLQPLFEPNGPMGTPVLSGGELKIYHRNTKGWKQVGDSMKIGTNELGFMDGRGDRYVG